MAKPIFSHSEAVQVVVTAHRAGRPIVPFLGAGISASSGFPLIEQLRQYLLKVKFFIRTGAYRTILGQPNEVPIAVFDPENSPARYLAEFGWPEINQLNADLYRIAAPLSTVPQWSDLIDPLWSEHLRKGQRAPRDPIPWIDSIMKRYCKSFGAATAPAAFSSYVDNTSSRWGIGRWRLLTAMQSVLLHDLRLGDSQLADAAEQSILALTLTPRADWFRLLMELTEGNLGLIDSLFARLGLRYAPSMAHFLLAHLTQRLGVRLLLTTNFDPFVEQAMVAEGLRPRVCDVGRDAVLPDPDVVRQTLAIIKLHGSAYGLRYGERLDYSLDDTTRHTIEQYVPEDALLLVVGFSGYERRMMQLIEHLTLRPSSSDRDVRAVPRILWMHWEPSAQLPSTVKDFEARLKSLNLATRYIPEQLADAGSFFFELYQHLFESFPRGHMPYSVLDKRINRLAGAESEHCTPTELTNQSLTVRSTALGHPTAGLIDQLLAKPVHLFCRDSFLTCRQPPYFLASQPWAAPSLEMSRFVQELSGYHVIWLDLEDHHTVAGVVAELVEKMRVYDPELSSVAMPFRADDRPEPAALDELCEKPIRFLHRALRRGRYVLVFDTLEGFGREHTSHHGLPAHEPKDDAGDQSLRVTELLHFLSRLIAPGNISSIDGVDWYCCVSCDEPSTRHVVDLSSSANLCSSVRQRIIDFVQRHAGARIPTRLPNHTAAQVEIAKSLKTDTSCVLRITEGEFQPRSTFMSDRGHAEAHPLRALSMSLLGRLDTNVGLGLYLQESKECSSQLQNDFTLAVESILEGICACTRDLRMTTLDRMSDKTFFAAFLVLSLFRRPRPRAAINVVLGGLLPPRWELSAKKRNRWIDRLLKTLCDEGVLQYTSGGFYWIHHHWHRLAYKMLSEPARMRHIYDCAPSEMKAPKNHEELVMRLARAAFLAIAHSRIARFYYTHAFKRSGDAIAFFEYMYHRTSALRYMRVAQLYTSMACCAPSFCEHLASSGRLHKMFVMATASLCSSEGTARDIESLSARVLTCEDIAEMVTELNALRVSGLNGFMTVLQYENPLVSTVGSAETWLAWIQQLKRDLDIVAGHRLPIRLSGADANQQVKAAWLADTFDLESARFKCASFLSDLEGRLLREKRSWRACVRSRLRLIASVLTAACDHLSVSGSNRLDLARSRALAGQLDCVGADVMRQTTIVTFKDVRRYWDLLLKHGSLEVLFNSTSDRLIRECALTLILNAVQDICCCVRHIQAAFPLAENESGAARDIDILRLLVDAMPYGPKEDTTAKWVQAIRGVESSRDVCCRFHHDMFFELRRIELENLSISHRALRGAFRDAGHDYGWLTSARLRRLAAELDGRRHEVRCAQPMDPMIRGKQTCRFHLLQVQCLIQLGCYAEAAVGCDHALQLLDETIGEHRTLMAMCECVRAQNLYLNADDDLKRRRPEMGLGSQVDTYFGENDCNEPLQAYSTAKAKLDAAGAALDRAESLLRRRRAHLGLWRRVFTEEVQVQIEHLLLIQFALEFNLVKWDNELAFVARIHRHLNRALEAVRGGWDCSLAPKQLSPFKEVDDDRRLWKVLWLELMICGFITLNRFAATYDVARNQRPLFQTGIQTPLQERLSARRAANQISDSIGSIKSFLARWRALNLSAGLDRFVIDHKVYERLVEEAVSEETVALIAGKERYRGELLSREYTVLFLREKMSRRAHRWEKPGAEMDELLSKIPTG